MKNGYGIFLMIELARCKGIIDEELEYDLTWENGTGLFNEFQGGKFDRADQPLYECIEEFLNTKK